MKKTWLLIALFGTAIVACGYGIFIALKGEKKEEEPPIDSPTETPVL